MGYGTYDVRLIDDGTLDTVVKVNGLEFRFSPEIAAEFRDETGALTPEGWKELKEAAIEAYLQDADDFVKGLLGEGDDE